MVVAACRGVCADGLPCRSWFGAAAASTAMPLALQCVLRNTAQHERGGWCICCMPALKHVCVCACCIHICA